MPRDHSCRPTSAESSPRCCRAWTVAVGQTLERARPPGATRAVVTAPRDWSGLALPRKLVRSEFITRQLKSDHVGCSRGNWLRERVGLCGAGRVAPRHARRVLVQGVGGETKFARSTRQSDRLDGVGLSLRHAPRTYLEGINHRDSVPRCARRARRGTVSESAFFLSFYTPACTEELGAPMNAGCCSAAPPPELYSPSCTHCASSSSQC